MWGFRRGHKGHKRHRTFFFELYGREAMADLAQKHDRLFLTTFRRKHRTLVMALNCAVVFGLIFFSQWLIYVKYDAAYVRRYIESGIDLLYERESGFPWISGPHRGDEYRETRRVYLNRRLNAARLWLAVFFAQTACLRYLHGRAGSDRPLENYLWFFIFLLTSTALVPSGSLVLSSLVWRSTRPFDPGVVPAIKAQGRHALTVAIALMFYLHFYILAWRSAEEPEDENRGREEWRNRWQRGNPPGDR